MRKNDPTHMYTSSIKMTTIRQNRENVGVIKIATLVDPIEMHRRVASASSVVRTTKRLEPASQPASQPCRPRKRFGSTKKRRRRRRRPRLRCVFDDRQERVFILDARAWCTRRQGDTRTGEGGLDSIGTIGRLENDDHDGD